MSVKRVVTGMLLGGLSVGPTALAAAQDRTPVESRRWADTVRLRSDSMGFRLQGNMGMLMTERLNFRRARLGVVVNLRGVPTDTIGALITGVTPGGPAAQAGVEAGDLVVRFNGQSLIDRELSATNPEESIPGVRLIELTARLAPNDTVRLDLRRGRNRRMVKFLAEAEPGLATFTPLTGGGFVYSYRDQSGEEQTRRLDQPRSALEMTLRRLERDHVFEVAPPQGFEPRLQLELLRGPLTDLELTVVNPQLGSYFGTSEGILVVKVAEGNPLKLQAGDVILSIDSRKPTSPGHLLRILRTYEGGEAVAFELMRQKKRVTVTGSLREAKER